MRRNKDRKHEQRPLSGSALANDAAERLATIVNAAERAAEQVIDDAEARARQILAEADAEAERVAAERIAELDETAEALAAQAEAIRGEAGRLLELLAQTREGLGAAAEPAPPAASRGAHLSAVDWVADPEPAAFAAEADFTVPARGGTPAGARLLATQMAVSGSSREEIETRLRNGFEIEDTTAILDAILGPED